MNSVAAIETQRVNLSDSISLIDVLAQGQMADQTGVAMDKNEVKRQMGKMAVRVAAAVSAYANVQNDQTLQQKMHLTPTTFDGRDNVVADIAQGVFDEATKVLGPAKNYGLTQATLDGLQTRIDTYKLAMMGPQMAGAQRQQFTALMEGEFKRGDMIIRDRIDKLMLQFEESAPDVWAAYQAARKIINSGHRPKAQPATPTPATPATPTPPPTPPQP